MHYVHSNSVYTLNDLQIHETSTKSGQGGIPDLSITIKHEVVLPHSVYRRSYKIITENTREDSSKNENLKLSIGLEINYTTVGGRTLPSFRIYDGHLLVGYL